MTSTIIGISGGSGAGKTTISNTIKERYSGDILIIDLNDFHDPNVRDPESSYCIDIDRLVKVLTWMKIGAAQHIEKYDHNTGTYVRDHVITYAAKVVIIDGAFPFHHHQLRSLIDINVYVKCDLDTALIRCIRKNMANPVYAGDAADALSDYLHKYETYIKPKFDNLISLQEKNADVIVDTTDISSIDKMQFINIILSTIAAK